MENYNIQNTANKLDKISNAFCLAKYDLFTLHLHLGAAHSCHLTDLKKLDSDLINGPYDFFNFPEIKKIRQEMKEGIQSEDCIYCWKTEKNSKFSDRHIQSYGIEYRYDEIVKMNPLEDDIIPSYLEVSFSNLCNLKCTYCNDNFSSRWESDIKKYGDYKYVDGRKSKNEIIKGDNQILEKFKLFFPEIIKNLKLLRITGGEPTLHDELYDILNYIKNNPQKDLTLCINTNLCSNPKKIDKFIDSLKELQNNVKKITIYTSCDTSGKHAEFIREGLDYSYWKENCHRILKEINNSNLNIMCTLNNLCFTNEFKVFINDIYDMTEYGIGKNDVRTYFNIQPIANPAYQTIDILDYDIFENIIKEIEDLLNSYILKKENGIIISKGFLKMNVEKFHSVKRIIKNSKQNDNRNRQGLLYFLKQCKIRNGKDFFDVFNDINYRRYFLRLQNKEEVKTPLIIIKTNELKKT